MNHAQILDHFDRISDAPDAIPRMRRFILDLAVGGKLVNQEPNDEPASDLLKRIESEREQLLNHGRGPREKPVPTINAEEVDFEIPQNWVWVRLGKVIKLWNGFAFRSSDFQIQGVPVIRIGDLQGGEVVLSSAVYVSEQLANSVAPEVWIPTDALLIAMSGATTGKVAFNRTGRRLLLNQRVGRVQSFLISQAFLKFFFDTIVTQNLNISFGTAIPNLSTQQVNQIYFPLPPLAEQHRIVAKVDELMALCDQLETAQADRESKRDKLAAASLHRLNNGADADEFRKHARFHLHHLPRLATRPEHIQQLRQTILNLAVRGKVVPQDPNDGPAAELLKLIQAEKARLLKKGTIKRAQAMSPIETTEIPSAVPDGWEWVRLGDLLLGDSQNGYSKKPDDAADGIPILRISAGTLRKDGIVAEEEHKLIGGVSTAQKEQYELQPGDLLACRFNGNRSFVGRLSLYLGYLGMKPIYPDKLIRLRLLSKFVLPKLVRYFAESNVVRKDIEAYCATTVGNWGISASNLKDVKVPLPPLAEQHRIVAKVDELMALCDRLEARLTESQTESRRLLEAVLHEALKLRTGNDRSAHL